MRYMKLPVEEREALLERLVDMPAFLEATFGALAPAATTLPGPDDAFSPVEQCWHLADLEREGYLTRIARLLDEDDPELPDFDGDRVAEERRYASLSLREGLRAFRAARAETLARLRGVAGDDWRRAGRQEGVGAVMLCDLPAMIAAHDASHRAEIEAWLAERRG